jgi:hypothetical protein
MQAPEGGPEYWSWAKTPTDMVFGIAARDDDFNNYWIYVADGDEPRGGAGSAGWKHILEADFPDW